MLLFESDTLQVAANDATMGASKRALSPVNTSGEVAAAIVGAALVSLPLLLISAKMLKDSLAIKRNMMLRQLYSRTLLPNESADGFVYAALPAEGHASDVYSVTLVIQRVGTGGVRTASSYQLEI